MINILSYVKKNVACEFILPILTNLNGISFVKKFIVDWNLENQLKYSTFSYILHGDTWIDKSFIHLKRGQDMSLCSQQDTQVQSER